MTEKNRFSAEMLVSEALATHPSVADIFRAFGLDNCPNCPAANSETISKACEAFGKGLDEFLTALNGLEFTASVPTK